MLRSRQVVDVMHPAVGIHARPATVLGASSAAPSCVAETARPARRTPEQSQNRLLWIA